MYANVFLKVHPGEWIVGGQEEAGKMEGMHDGYPDGGLEQNKRR